MEKEYYYNCKVNWTEGRKGILSEEGLTDIETATPPEFPKGVGGVWSPEHLFVASVNICLMTTFTAIAELSKLEFSSYSCKAKGKMEKVEKGFQFTQIELFPVIKVTQEKDIERAERIIQKAENNCLISNSIKAEITLSPEISID